LHGTPNIGETSDNAILKDLVLVFIGGGIGSCLRYLFSVWLNPVVKQFPLGTFAANFLSCVIFGGISYWLLQRISFSEQLRLLILVGLCGGFSTFSTFSNELHALLQQGDWFWLAAYLLGSLLLGVAGIVLGIWAVRLLG